jgi:hypothetical protein
LKYLTFEFSENAEGLTTLEAMASTSAEQHGAAMAEVQQVLDWAWAHFAHSHGPADEGNDWDHELQLSVEDGRWHAIALTLTGSAAFVAEFQQRFGGEQD